MPLLGRPIGLILIGVIILSIISGMKYAKIKLSTKRPLLYQRDLLMINNRVRLVNVKDKVILITGGAGARLL